MIEQFAIIGGKAPSEFLDPSYTSKSMILVSLMSANVALEPELPRTSESGH
jgi:hypothetical protein